MPCNPQILLGEDASDDGDGDSDGDDAVLGIDADDSDESDDDDDGSEGESGDEGEEEGEDADEDASDSEQTLKNWGKVSKRGQHVHVCLAFREMGACLRVCPGAGNA